MATQYEDHDAVDTEMWEQEHLDWTMLRPVMLAEGDAANVRDWDDLGKGVGMFAKVTRRSVASSLVDTVEKAEWFGRTPVLSN